MSTLPANGGSTKDLLVAAAATNEVLALSQPTQGRAQAQPGTLSAVRLAADASQADLPVAHQNHGRHRGGKRRAEGSAAQREAPRRRERKPRIFRMSTADHVAAAQRRSTLRRPCFVAGLPPTGGSPPMDHTCNSLPGRQAPGMLERGHSVSHKLAQLDLEPGMTLTLCHERCMSRVEVQCMSSALE